jgi:hypothetical protein
MQNMRLLQFASILRRNTSGLALVEFGMGFPVLLALGMYGLDTANFALTNLKVNQIALNLADNASRVGLNTNLSTQQLREIDINDVFEGAKDQGTGINLNANARVILSSLEKDSSGTQRLHWQRCFGLKTGTTYESHYGKAVNADGSTTTGNSGPLAPNGMGDTGYKVNAPSSSSGVMFVEVNYRYTPMFSWLSAPSDLRYVASFIVRDPRDFTKLYTSTGVTPSYCGYTAQVVPT